MAEEIQLLTCGYSAQCTVRGCRARATMLAKYTDNQGPAAPPARAMRATHGLAQGEPKECLSSSEALKRRGFIRDEDFRDFPLSILFIAQQARARTRFSFSDVACPREAQIALFGPGKPWAKSWTGTVQSQAGWRMHGA